MSAIGGRIEAPVAPPAVVLSYPDSIRVSILLPFAVLSFRDSIPESMPSYLPPVIPELDSGIHPTSVIPGLDPGIHPNPTSGNYPLPVCLDNAIHALGKAAIFCIIETKIMPNSYITIYSLEPVLLS